MRSFGRRRAGASEWPALLLRYVCAGGWTPTAQFDELGQAKPQACARIPGAELKQLAMSVKSGIDASPQTAGSSEAILGPFTP